MTDTTAPLAVTMDLVEQAEVLTDWLHRRAAYSMNTAYEGYREQWDTITLEAWRDNLRALTAIARRCLEPDGAERVAKALRVKCAEIDHRPDVHEADPMWFADEYALTAIAALVNPNGK